MYVFIFLIVLIVLLALINLFRPQIKGFFGETKVAAILESLPLGKYETINNVMLKTDRGTTQIDHIVVSVYGIFVIETKNYKGWITGRENSEMWTKNMYGKKYSFKNPIRQNYGHILALEKLLDLPKDVFIPIVVFSVESDLKVTVESEVVYTVNLKKTIEKYKVQKFNEDKISYIVDKIKSNNVDSRDMRKEHVSNIQNTLQSNEEKIQHNICPKCGGQLVKRKGKYGEFYGCSNYPKCRYTVDKK